METFGERLKAARERKGLMQRDVAAALDCAPTSLTNWERGKVQPPLEVLARLCEALGVNPLDLLDKHYTFDDIVGISSKPAYERSYQETVALNFSREILEKLMPAESKRKESERNKKTAEFLRGTNMAERFGGELSDKDIKALKREYDGFGGADADILFAYHALAAGGKAAFLDMLLGLLANDDNIQEFGLDLEPALLHTIDRITRQARLLRHPDNFKGQGGIYDGDSAQEG